MIIDVTSSPLGTGYALTPRSLADDLAAAAKEVSSSAASDLTEEDQRVVQELKARDREVRAHEQAHKTVGGPYTGAISYEYQRGPDGIDYAIGGEVPIDASAEDTPKETIAKMEVIIRAALAPAEPSPQDRAVARAAQATLSQAEADLRIERVQEREQKEAQAEEAQKELVAETYAQLNQFEETSKKVDVAT